MKMKRGLGFVLGLGLLVSGAAGVVPIGIGSGLGTQAAYADANVVSVGTFAELLEAFDMTYDNGESGSVTINLTDDIEQTYGENDYMWVNAGWTVTLNLAGHTLVLRNDGMRGMRNNGTLIVTGAGTITDTTNDTMNEAWGLIDNYGTLTIENGTIIDYGQGGGAALKNRPGGVMNLNGGTVTGYATAGGNACVYSEGVLNIADGVELRNYATDETHSDSTSSWYGAYAMVVNSGTATIGTTVGAVASPVRVDGNRGAIAINSGTVVINNGQYRGGKYYGFWITNNGDVSDVTVNYAEVYGKKYGVYAAVDDGRQDLSDVGIVIKDGVYSGETKAAVAVNSSNSENSFGMGITGGKFSSEPNQSYIAADHRVALDVDGLWRVVDPEEIAEDGIEIDVIDGEDVPRLLPKEEPIESRKVDNVEVIFNDELVVDRKAELEVELLGAEDEECGDYQIAGDGELLGIAKITLRDRDGGEIEVGDHSMTISIEIDRETYDMLSAYDKIEVVYFDKDDKAETERLAAELKSGETDDGMVYWVEFTTTHLSTYGVVGVNEEEEEAVVPNTGRFTKAAEDFAEKNSRVGVFVLGLGMIILGYGLVLQGKAYQKREK